LQKTGGLFKKLRGRNGIGLLRPLDLGSTPEIRSAGGRASARRHERLTGGPGGQSGRGQLTGGAERAKRARTADRRGSVDRKAGCGGKRPWAVGLQVTARIRLGLFETGPFDLRWTTETWRLASVPFPSQQRRWRPHPRRGSSPETRGAGALRVLRATGVAWEVGEGAGNLLVGARSGQGHRRGRSTAKWLGGGAKRLGKELSAAGCNRGEGRGQRRFLTSRRTPGTPRWRRRRGGGPG
jgi:hypothetical protein